MIHDAEYGSESRCFVISGCSGGGKSTLLDALAARGHATVPEAGREVVREQLRSGGDALPWSQPERFLELVALRVAAAFEQHRRIGDAVFFDRGIVEALNHFESKGLPLPASIARAARECCFARRVFVTPPWPEIYVNDAERRHSFADALAEYETLVPCYERHGYEVLVVPRAPVVDRIDFVLLNIE